jgi:DNA-directed RNA polymerase subunit RPC12/RpoP
MLIDGRAQQDIQNLSSTSMSVYLYYIARKCSELFPSSVSIKRINRNVCPNCGNSRTVSRGVKGRPTSGRNTAVSIKK